MPPWRGRHFIVVQVFGTFVERDQGRLERLDGEVGLAFLVLTYLIVRKKVYLSTEGQLLCEHGELASNISYWCAMEKKAKVDGLCPPPRGGHSNHSICTCQTTEGMNVTLAESITPPTRPSSLFEFLETSGTEIIKVKGRDARRVPHTKDAAFVSTVGQVTCRHGASRRSLIKKERSTTESKRLPKCGCSIRHLQVNGGVQLGKFVVSRHCPTSRKGVPAGWRWTLSAQD